MRLRLGDVVGMSCVFRPSCAPGQLCSDLVQAGTIAADGTCEPVIIGLRPSSPPVIGGFAPPKITLMNPAAAVPSPSGVSVGPAPLLSATAKLYIELGVAAGIVMLAPGAWKLLAAVPIMMAIGGSLAL